MKTPPEVARAVARWAYMSRWDRAELGRYLRRLGWTYGEIMTVLPVGKGTLSGWCRDIRLTEEQIEAIKARRPPGVRTGIPVDTQRKRRQQIKTMQQMAALEVPRLIKSPLWLAGTVLYWAEGSKTKRILEMVNTDPRTLELFIQWVREFHDRNASFVLSLHLHEGNNEPEAMSFWREAVGLPDARFTKTFIKPAGTGHRKNKLACGVCRVQMRRSTDAWWRTLAWIESLATGRHWYSSNGSLAQLAAQRTLNPWVPGSSPGRPTSAGVAELA